MPRSRPKSGLRPIVLAVVAGSLALACGPTDPVPEAEDTTTTTVDASTTTTRISPTSVPEDVSCGTELPYFPTDTIDPIDPNAIIDVEGQTGPAPDGEPAAERQLVRHWPMRNDVTIEMRWPAGPGPSVDSSIVLTQLLETTDEAPCDVVRVSVYGPEDRAADIFTAFVASLDGVDVKETFVTEQIDGVTPAVAEVPGTCAEPILTTVDDDGQIPDDAASALVMAYIADRTAGAGFEDCLTLSGLADVEASLAELGTTDIVRPAGQVSDNRAEVLTSFVTDGSLEVWRELLTIVAVGDGDEKQILFSGMIIGPDSLVGEDEAVAFIDEFLQLLAEDDYEQAAGYLVNEGVSPEVEAAMPTILEDPAAALESYCRTAACAVTYKVSDTLDFDGTSRTIELTYFHPDETIELPTRVSVFEGQLVIGTPPPPNP